ncbi:MAG: hypothetical protein AAGC77_11015 [Pseudomonadota bacterium]
MKLAQIQRADTHPDMPSTSSGADIVSIQSTPVHWTAPSALSVS